MLTLKYWPHLKDTLINFALGLSIGIGLLSFAFYLSWWFEGSTPAEDRWRSPVFLLVLIFAVAYGGIQLIGNWFLYIVARRPSGKEADALDLSVDVFVTAYGEPYEMIKKTLIAACAMRGKHATWLLDDGANPQLSTLAKSLDVGYLTRSDHKYAKAGNLNAALSKTDGDIVVIFDIDHVPVPEFLERSLGYFSDTQLGFVQVMLTFGNIKESWVADAAIETSLEFYNPTSLGAYSIGGATLMGSNALIRRTALESIDGYQPGLAEDLATSINLHAAGWKSAYVGEPLAPGLAPPNFVAWFIQQMKWARGVFELLVTTFPKLFHKLTWGQRLSYAIRMTKYWIGPAVFIHMFATIAILIFGDAATRNAFHNYLIHITPLVACDALIRYFGLYKWRHDTMQNTSLLRAIILVYATWPIYLAAWLMAVFRINLTFRLTPKSGEERLHPIWLAPQLITIILLFTGMLYTVIVKDHQPSFLLLFAIVQGMLQFLFLWRWMNTDFFPRRRNPIAKDAVVKREPNQ